MPIVSFGFDKIHIEKKELYNREDQIKNNIRLEDLKETKLKTDSKKEMPALIAKFSFEIDYGRAGNLELKGYVIYYDTEKVLKEINDEWTKGKKLPIVFSAQIFNFVLLKSNIKGLQLEEEVGLPLHLRLPRFKVNTGQKEVPKEDKKEEK